jgi:DNA-binding NarL/FixJ family response regulator
MRLATEAGRPLSPAMLDVLRLSARGLKVEATAYELHVSSSTVRARRAAILARLGVPNMTAAVDVAHRTGQL